MATYKTPGVYVEEIVKFPPSVAQVETAIPAFIGYTDKATNKVKGDLSGKATRISSMLEYETFFGYAKPETTITVEINDTLVNGVKESDILVNQPSSKEPFLMYYSLQMYFANGGGPCYIISVGQYGSEAQSPVTAINNADDFKTGLGVLRKVDEPTLIVFPDATALSTDNEFYSLYDDALKQCKDLQDRFTIIDTRTYDATSPTDANIDNLRNTISSNKDEIKYGAAYYPFLKTILDYNYNTEDVSITHYSYDASAYETIKKNLATIEDATNGIPGIVKALFEYTTPGVVGGDVSGDVSDVLLQMYAATGFDLGGTFNTNDTKKTAFIAAVKALVESMGKLVDLKDNLNAEANAAAKTITEENPTIEADIKAALVTFNVDFDGAGKIDEIYANLVELNTKLQNANTDAKLKNLLNVNTVNFDAEIKKLVDYTPLNTQTALTAVPTTLFGDIGTNLTDLATEIKKVEGKDKNNGALNGRKLSDVEAVDNAAYNRILTEIGNLPLELPPSSTMAGIYAKVDSSRGVWKAPANVSVSYVIEPTVNVSHEDQQNLNVDVVAGKSINAIRSFVGKGTLVWGARTLAGNDAEWRYVPVRRFFNMAEESIKKATEQFVFEPNDKNTWVRVKAMIDNFLTLQWRAGALAGPTPDKAFYVSVGLGETMTAQDILEGNMIIEIGMAVVRPAEFIILKFSHKMQEV